MANNVLVNTNPSPFDWEFVVENISDKDISIFNVLLNRGERINVTSIPFVSENDIKKSLFKGEILSKINAGEIRVVSSNIDFQSYSPDFTTFANNNNIPNTENKASQKIYTPANPGDWAPVPSNPDTALDTLAAIVGGGPLANDIGKSISVRTTTFATLLTTTFFNSTFRAQSFVPSDIFSFTLPSTQITVLKTGLYFIAFRLNCDNPSGAGRGVGAARLAINGVPQTYTTVYAFSRNIPEGEGTAKYFDTFFLNSGDVITLEVARADTEPIVLFSIPGTGISLNFLR